MKVKHTLKHNFAKKLKTISHEFLGRESTPLSTIYKSHKTLFSFKKMFPFEQFVP